MEFLSLGIWGLKPMGKVEVPFNFQEKSPRNVEGSWAWAGAETLKPSCHTWHIFIVHFVKKGGWVAALDGLPHTF